MIHRPRRLVDSAIVAVMISSLCILSYADPEVSSVDTNQPTTSCTPVTATPCAGVLAYTNQLAKQELTKLPEFYAKPLYIVGHGIVEDDFIEETNDEEQLKQSTTTDEYLTTDDEPNIEESADAPEETVLPTQDDCEESKPSNTSVSQHDENKIVASDGVALNSHNGRVKGPSGEETYYNLDMSNCVKRMQSMGYDYEYWVRDDGAKMFGPYVMAAADFSTRPLGTVLPTTLGECIVVDTGTFIETNPGALDIATTW